MASKKQKQSEIPGTEREVDDDLEEAIEALQEAKATRTKAKAAVDQAAEKLEALMVERSIEEYVSTDLEARVVLEEKSRLSLRQFKVKETSYDEAAE